MVSTYTVADPEGVVITGDKWSLAGADSALFKLTGTDDNVRTLEFKERADFENPADRDRDNIYEVTVVASDGEEMAERAVTVKIVDRDEAGKITLSSENPVTGTPITATLEDSDGDVINVAWAWYALDAADDELADTGADANVIGDETSDSYTPMPGDIGKHLVAVARYMDRTEDEDNDDGTPTDVAEFIRFDNSATSAPTAPVIDDPANEAPEFVEGHTAVRYVEEDAGAGETIGAPLEITDADGVSAGSHNFTLSGTDAASFDIEPVTFVTGAVTGGGPANDQGRPELRG